MSGLHHLKTIIIQLRRQGDANTEITATDSWYNKPGIFLFEVQQKQEKNFKTLHNLLFVNDGKGKEIDFLHTRFIMIPNSPQIHPRFHNILDMKNILRIVLRFDSLCSKKN